METTAVLPPELQELVGTGKLRRISDTEFVIDALRHRVNTGWGWQTMVYTLRIGELEDCDFEIVEESEYSGEECLLATSDAEEVEDWITQQIDEMDG